MNAPRRKAVAEDIKSTDWRTHCRVERGSEEECLDKHDGATNFHGLGFFLIEGARKAFFLVRIFGEEDRSSGTNAVAIAGWTKHSCENRGRQAVGAGGRGAYLQFEQLSGMIHI